MAGHTTIKFQKIEDLNLLQKQSIANLVELAKLAFDYIKNGPIVVKYHRLAEVLQQDDCNTTIEQVQKVVEIIAQFLLDAVKFKAKESDYLELTEMGLTEEHAAVLKQFVDSKAEHVAKLLKGKQGGGSDLRYRNLDWRLEARVASRSLHSQAVPIITMKMHLDDEMTNEKRDVLNTRETQVVMQTDPNSLVHIIATLEEALLESKAHRTRNFVKAINK